VLKEGSTTAASSGGELGRRSGGLGQELWVLHDPASTFLDRERHVRAMITTNKEKEGAKEHLTAGFPSGDGGEAEAAAMGECGARARGSSVREQKRGESSSTTLNRNREGRRGSGEGAGGGGALAIDGRRLCGRKEGKKMGNSKAMKGNQARGLRLLIEAHGWKGERRRRGARRYGVSVGTSLNKGRRGRRRRSRQVRPPY
jgi:hypothetical protein